MSKRVCPLTEGKEKRNSKKNPPLRKTTSKPPAPYSSSKEEKIEKFDELLSILKELNITQKKSTWEDEIPEDIWNEHFENNHKAVATGISISTHRWYETSIEVIEIYGRFLGIRFISNVFSESMDYEDCYETIEFMEMEAIREITFKIKNK